MLAVSKSRPAEEPVPQLPRFQAEHTREAAALPRVNLAPWQESVENAEARMGPLNPGNSSRSSVSFAASHDTPAPSANSAPAFFSPPPARVASKQQTRNLSRGPPEATAVLKEFETTDSM
jgi:hypothetical protein